jgi:hypothetical protein
MRCGSTFSTAAAAPPGQDRGELSVAFRPRGRAGRADHASFPPVRPATPIAPRFRPVASRGYASAPFEEAQQRQTRSAADAPPRFFHPCPIFCRVPACSREVQRSESDCRAPPPSERPRRGRSTASMPNSWLRITPCGTGSWSEHPSRAHRPARRPGAASRWGCEPCSDTIAAKPDNVACCRAAKKPRRGDPTAGRSL